MLEPPGAQPVIVEDDCFIGSRAIVVEGVLVEREAVIGAGVALTASTPGSRTPLYRFMFTSGRAWGFPAQEYALAAYRALLQGEAAAAPWMIAGHEVDLRQLIPATVASGGHVRVGLEDAPYGTELRNIDWVESAVAAIEKSGGTPATASEIRLAS